MAVAKKNEQQLNIIDYPNVKNVCETDKKWMVKTKRKTIREWIYVGERGRGRRM